MELAFSSAAMLCDASGDVRHLRLVSERLRCHLDGAVLAALASVFATAERVELGNNPNLRVTSGSGERRGAPRGTLPRRAVLTHLHVSGSPVFDDGDDDGGATFSQAACATPSGLVSLRLPNSGLRGPVPDGCVVTATLRDAQLHDNRLNGTLPAVPSVRRSRCSPRIATVCGGSVRRRTRLAPSDLTVFLVSHNRLEGTLPAFGGVAQPALHSFGARSNLLEDPCPSVCWARGRTLSMSSTSEIIG